MRKGRGYQPSLGGRIRRRRGRGANNDLISYGGRLRKNRGKGFFGNMLKAGKKLLDFGRKGYNIYKTNDTVRNIVNTGVKKAANYLDNYGTEKKAEGIKRRSNRAIFIKNKGKGMRKRRGRGLNLTVPIPNSMSGPLP